MIQQLHSGTWSVICDQCGREVRGHADGVSVADVTNELLQRRWKQIDAVRWRCADCHLNEPPAPSAVDHPPHYNVGQIEVIDAIEEWKLGFHLGNVV